MVADVSTSDRGIRIACVTSREALDRLRPEWDALWARVPDRTPFQSTAWLLPWWDIFGRGDLRALEIRNDRRLVGLVPLYLSDESGGELRLLGAGNSDYLDALAAPGHESDVAHALERYLECSRQEWRFCTFDHVRPGSVLLRANAPDGLHDLRADDTPCPTLDVPRSVDFVPDAIGASLAADIRYCRRRAERLGGLSVVKATPENVDELLTALFELHRIRWARKGGNGVLGDDAVRAFHRTVAPALLEAGLLRLFALRVGGRTAAVQYGMQTTDRAFFYISGFDPRFASLSAGKLALAAALEQAVTEGVFTFDFLGGREAYKYEWGATDRPRLNRQLRRVPS